MKPTYEELEQKVKEQEESIHAFIITHKRFKELKELYLAKDKEHILGGLEERLADLNEEITKKQKYLDDMPSIDYEYFEKRKQLKIVNEIMSVLGSYYYLVE